MINRRRVKVSCGIFLCLLTIKMLKNEYDLMRELYQEPNTSKIEFIANNNHTNSSASALSKITPTETKLQFIMHVGPPKTGTTTLQCALRYLENKNLLPGNVSIMETQACTLSEKGDKKFAARMKFGKFDKADKKKALTFHVMHDCLKLWNGTEMPKCWKSLYYPFVTKNAKYNNSIIVSKEVLCFLIQNIKDKELKMNLKDKFWNEFALSLQPYQLVILITYRNFFDWIYSYYTQQYKFFGRPLLSKWPENGGHPIPSPEEYVAENLLEYNDTYLLYKKEINFYSRKYFPDKLMEAFSNISSISMKIINMDTADDVKKLFFCDGLPSSFHMCNLVDKISLSLKKNEAPDYIWCDMLTTKAREDGFISSTTINRKDITNAIRKHQEKKNLSCFDFPKKCPSNHFYDTLFEKAMELHYKVFPDDAGHDNVESMYREKFERSKSKFCTLNATAVLDDSEWREFLSKF